MPGASAAGARRGAGPAVRVVGAAGRDPRARVHRLRAGAPVSRRLPADAGPSLRALLARLRARLLPSAGRRTWRLPVLRQRRASRSAGQAGAMDDHGENADGRVGLPAQTREYFMYTVSAAAFTSDTAPQRNARRHTAPRGDVRRLACCKRMLTSTKYFSRTLFYCVP